MIVSQTFLAGLAMSAPLSVLVGGAAALWYRSHRRSKGTPLSVDRDEVLRGMPAAFLRSLPSRVSECRQLARVLAEHEPAFLLRYPETVDWLASIDSALTSIHVAMDSNVEGHVPTTGVYDRLRAVVLSMAAQGAPSVGHDRTVDVERRRRVAASFLVAGNEPVFSSIPAQYEGPTTMRRMGTNGLYQDVVFASVRQAHIAAALVAARDDVAPAEVELVASPDADVEYQTAADWATH